VKILVFNAGSSSLKYKLFETESVHVDDEGRPHVPHTTLSEGTVENIGQDNAHFINDNGTGRTFNTVSAAGFDEAMDLIIHALIDVLGAPLDNLSEVDAVGHRVAHGGDAFSCSQRIDRHVIDVIEHYSDLAPLHNPYALDVIRRARVLFPHALQVAAFDTAFHQTMPRRSYIYPIPYRYYEEYGIRRFGFHGISHKYVSRRAAEFLGEDLRSLKMITCHLGAGASITAIDHGYSMDTSMGYTPLDGVMMNTRSGSVDPAIITAIMDKENLTPQQMDEILNRESGFLGVSGTSGDLRDLKEVIRYGDTEAELAYDIFLFSVRRMIGAYAFELAGIDCIVVTAGVGENDSYARRLIFRGLEPFGIEIDEQRNQAEGKGERIISTDRAAVKVLVIPTDEEAEIARDVSLISAGIDISNPWAY
jgi:acetate kinase